MAKYSFPQAIKQPSIIPYLISGENAPAFLEEINRTIDDKFNGNKHLKALTLRGSGREFVAVGSNSLVLPVVQMVAPGYRTGRPEDFQKTLNDGDILSIKGNHYADMGVVLDFTGRNHEMALDFYSQMPKELVDFDRMPAVVVGYGLKNFDKGNYNLGLVVNANTQIRPAKILAGRNGQFNNEDVSLETGLPSKLIGGDRTLYTSTQKASSLDNLGLSRLYLGGDLNIGSYGEDLAYSGAVGLVVLF